MPDDEVGIRIKIKEAAKAISEIGGVKAAIAGVGTTASKSNKELAAMSSQGLSSFSGIANSVRSAGRQIAQFSGIALAGGIAATGFGLKSASSLEQTNISLRKLLGSQPAATKMMKDLQNFANTTPFDFTQTMDAATSLLAQNFKPDELIRTLQVISDTTAATGKGAQGFSSLALVLAQMRNETKLNTRDLNQMTDAGVDGLGILAEKAHKTRAEMFDLVGQGKVSGSQAGDVIAKGLEARFGGLSQEAGKTLGAQWSNFIGKIKSGLYTVDEKGVVGGTLGPLVQILERNLGSLARDGGPAERAMKGVGQGIKSLVDGINDLAWFYRMGGFEAVLGRISMFLPFGINLVTIWRHLKTDTRELADVWQGSLYPSIKNVAIILAPLVFGTLAVLEGTLKWMADHPTAASIIFTTLGLALAEWAIIATLAKIYETIKLITLAFAAAQLAAGRFGMSVGGASLAAKLGLGEAAAVAVPAARLSYSEKTAQLLANAAPAAETAAVGSGIGLAGGIAAGGAAIGYLGKNLYDTYGSINKHFSTFGHFDTGGTKSMSGWTSINEKGDELVKLPGGSKVTNNKDFASMLKQAGKGTTVIFGEGSLQVSGFNYNEPKQFADLVIGEVQNRIARG